MMGATSRFEVSATTATPHDFTSNVRVFNATRNSESFITLHLEVGTVRVAMFLPADAHGSARAIADLWTTLGERQASGGGNGVRLSPEALALIGGPEKTGEAA